MIPVGRRSSSTVLPDSTARSSTVVSEAGSESGHSDEDDEQRGYMPLLIVGPSGSGKTFNLAACAAFHHIGLVRREAPKTILCVATTNTSVIALQVKMDKALSLDVPEDERPLAQGRREQILSLHTYTIHHACRQWLARYGHLLDERRTFAEICTAQRVERFLSLLEQCNDPDTADNPLDVRAIIRINRARLRDDVSINVPSDDFLSATIACIHRCRRVEMTASRLEQFIKSFKLNGRTADALLYEEANGREKVERATEFCEMYDELLRFNHLLDIEDLLVYGARLLQQHGRTIVQAEEIGTIIVDDLQNTSLFHRRIIRALFRSLDGQGCLLAACNDTSLAPIVGGYDVADRTVFGFAGADAYADPHDLMRQCVDEQNAFNVIELRENHRSTPAIQQLAYGMLQKRLWLEGRRGYARQFMPRLLGFHSIAQETHYLQSEIEAIQLADCLQDGSLGTVCTIIVDTRPQRALTQTMIISFRQIAILSRKNFHLRFLADNLTEAGVALRIIGQDDVSLSSPEAIDLLSFLCAIEDAPLAHHVERSFNVWSLCMNGVPRSTVPNVDFTSALLRMEDAEYAAFIEVVVDQAHRGYHDLLRSIKVEEQKGQSGIMGLLELILNHLQYKDAYLRAEHGNQSRLGARWENVQVLLRRAQDFDIQSDALAVDEHVHSMTLNRFLRLCDAYAPEELAFQRVRADNKVVLTTMHNALG